MISAKINIGSVTQVNLFLFFLIYETKISLKKSQIFISYLVIYWIHSYLFLYVIDTHALLALNTKIYMICFTMPVWHALRSTVFRQEDNNAQ